ncbi:zf-CCHC domain-containing protein [Tanacetum coccineum]
MHTARGDSVAGTKRCRCDLSSDGVRNLATTLGRGQLKEDLESSTWRRHELIGNLKVYEIVLEKDSEASKIKKEKYKSFALKARKVSSDEEESCSGSDEEYAMVFPQKEHPKSEGGKEGKKERRCFKCGDLNHFISDCPKHSFNDQKAFVGGCWSDSEEGEDDSKKDEICLMALDNNEVLSGTLYYSSSSLDSESLQNEYNKLEKNKEASVECVSCAKLHSKIESFSLKLAKFENSSHFLQEMIENQRTQKDKKRLGFTEDIASTSNTKTKKLSQESGKMSIVELDEPVPSAREPASSDVGNRPLQRFVKIRI